MPCRYCDREKPLVKAHVIPEGFYKRLWEGGTGPRMLTNTPDVYPKRAPIGAYDRGILCGECEVRFGPWDTYGQRVLQQDVPAHWQPIVHAGQTLAYECGAYNYADLKLFALSMLWRASVSTHLMFQRIQLGPHEQHVLQMLKTADPGESDDYGVVISKFLNPIGRVVLDPHPSRFDGLNYCQFYARPVLRLCEGRPANRTSPVARRSTVAAPSTGCSGA